MDQINFFHKGIVSDLDNSKVPVQNWVFPTMNLRIIDLKGHGFVGVPLNGTEHVFTIPLGFTPLAITEHLGVLYILAAYGQYVHLGTFPSVTYPGSGWVRVYGGVYNMHNGTNRIPFVTTGMGYSWKSNISMFARTSYDDTVDLYICDHENPNYVINTGLTTSGTYIDRFYYNYQVPKLIHQFLGSTTIPKMDYFQMHSGGSLKHGNYLIYIRYLDRSYNKTPFLECFGPFQITKGDHTASITGGALNEIAEKRLELHLENLDTDFPYFELALQYWAGDNASVVRDQFVIATMFDINADAKTVTILGDEETYAITPENLIVRNDSAVCKSHLMMDNRYWGGNWKGATYNRDALAMFAKLIRIGYSMADAAENDAMLYYQYSSKVKVYGGIEHEYGVTPGTYLSSSHNAKQQYKTYSEIYYEAAYFRGEIYPFGVVFELADHTFTEAFPVTGFDNYDGTLTCQGPTSYVDSDGNYLDAPGGTKTGSNNKGLYRFPFYDKNYTYPFDEINDRDRNMLVQFYTIYAKVYMQTYPEMFENVIGFRFVRGEKIENLLYQGLRLPTCYYDNVDQPIKRMPFNELSIPMNLVTVNNPSGNDRSYFGEIVIDPSGTGSLDGFYSFGNVCTSSPYTSYPNHEIPDFHVDDYHFALFAQDHFLETVPSLWSRDGVYILDLWEWTHAEYDPVYTGEGDEGVMSGSYHINWNTSTSGVHDPVTGYPENTLRGFRVFGNLGNLIYDNTVDSFAEANASSIEDYNASGNINGFASFAENGFTGRDYFCWDPEKTLNTDLTVPYGVTLVASIGNRTMHTGRYIGLRKIAAETHIDAIRKRRVSNIYRSKNDATFMAVNIASYDVASNKYNEITNFMEFDATNYDVFDDYITVSHGDCFLQRVYRRIMHWHSCSPEEIMMYEADENGDELDNSGIVDKLIWKNYNQRYEHGHMIGFMAEGRTNSACRHSTKDNTYYPYSLLAGKATWAAFVMTGSDDIYIDESNLYNKGYERTLFFRQHLGYDDTRPFMRMLWPTRIKYSLTNEPYTIADGFREIQISNYRDYDTKFGDITYLGSILGRLFSVQRDRINQHYTDNRGIEIPTSAGEATVGSTEILGGQVLELSTFGSQHMKSCVVTTGGLYGVDWLKGVIWQVTIGSVGFKQQGVAKDITLHAAISSEFRAYKELYDTYDDVLGLLPDKPAEGLGIVSGIDSNHGEVYFTFLWIVEDNDLGYVDRSRTFVFSEKINAFLGNASFTPRLYGELGGDLLSFGYILNELLFDGKAYTHTSLQYARFYGNQYPFQFSVMVNGYSEDKNTSIYTKIYNSWMAEMPEHELKQVTYETEYQTAVQQLQNITNFWEEVIHSEHRWNVPIDVQQSVEHHEFQPYSEMRGRWMRMTIEYESPVFTFVKNVITNYEISFR